MKILGLPYLKCYLTVVGLLPSLFLFSQESSIKLYANMLVHSEQIPRYYDDYSGRNSHYNGISVAYRRIAKNGLLHQLEAKFAYDKVESLHKRIDTALRYEIGGTMKRKIFKVLKLRFGKSFKVFHLDERITSKDYNEYPVDRKVSGLNSSIFSSLEFGLGKRFYVEMVANFAIMTIAFDRNYYDDPTRPAGLRNIGGTDFDFFNEKLLRIGLGFNL
jgi:hypothetical protein